MTVHATLDEALRELAEVRRLRREVETAAYVFERYGEETCMGECREPIPLLFSECGIFQVHCCTLRNCAIRHADLRKLEVRLTDKIKNLRVQLVLDPRLHLQYTRG